jgi:hypothetical protein
MAATLILAALVAHPGAAATAVESDGVATIVADQIRSQGFSCEAPISVQHIAAESSPFHTVYLLTCRMMAYRIVLIPHRAPLVAEEK